MLNTPRDVGGLAFLLKLPQGVMSIAHQSEFPLIFFDKLFGLEVRMILMRLHSHKDENPCLCPRMGCQMVQSIR